MVKAANQHIIFPDNSYDAKLRMPFAARKNFPRRRGHREWSVETQKPSIPLPTPSKGGHSYFKRFCQFSFLFLALSFASLGNAQNPLDQKIDISIENETMEDALFAIADEGGFSFAYNSNVIETEKVVEVQASGKEVNEILDDLLGQEVDYKVRGSYVIIQASAPPKDAKKSKHTIEGNISDAQTGQTLEDVTVYEVNNFKSTLSGPQGQYGLSVSNKEDYINLAISKKNYRDTVVQVSKIDPLPINIHLTPEKQANLSDQLPENTIDSAAFVRLLVNEKASKTLDNVDLIEEKAFQISLLPIVGTNRLMSGKITNRTSINIIAGYSHGVNGFEAGGFLNLARKDVKGLQLSGFGNMVGGNVSGFQGAGFFNATMGQVQGIQGSGFINLATDATNGAQFAGFINFARRNAALQAAGFGNAALHKSGKAQLASFFNYAHDMTGIQASGFCNVASGKMSGFQVTSILNAAWDVNGLQLALFNVADTVSSGVSIGLISYVRRGFHRIELNHDDVLDGSLSFKTGTHTFYNILSAGYRHDAVQPLLSAGYGFGTQINWSKRAYTNIEATSHTLHPTDRWESDLNLLNSLHLNFGYSFAKHFSVNAGPVYYLYVTKLYNPDSKTYGYDIATRPFHEETQSDTHVKMWIGWRLGVRF